jgi:hypothetical protein
VQQDQSKKTARACCIRLVIYTNNFLMREIKTDLRPGTINRNSKNILMLLFFMLLCVVCVNAQNSVLQTRVTLPRQTTTVYSMLNQISDQTGYFFIYDSQLINNNERVRIRRQRLEMQQWLFEILKDPSLRYQVVQNHILIFRPEVPTSVSASNVEPAIQPTHFTIRGRLLDRFTGEPLPFASVGIPERGLGIATNNDGIFQLRLPLDVIDKSLNISYMGYKNQELPLRLLRGTQMDIIMEPDYISMQEVIIRYYDPNVIMKQALARRKDNYRRAPVYLLSFYREGVQRNNKYLNYSEAIFRVFKQPYGKPFADDQVMMLKARTITNVDHTDTLVVKLKAGVQSALELDIMKHLPDFLDEGAFDKYDFESGGLATINGRNVYAIRFSQNQRLREPLFQGNIYIDMETLAFVEADFELNPKFINRAQHRFFTSRNPGYQVNMEKASYHISFQEYQGHYHLNHVRAEVEMKFRKRGQLFSNTYRAFLEMAVCHIDDQNVQRFSRREVLRPHTAFIDHGYKYDDAFWGQYNIITPEIEISEALSEMRSRIESFIPESYP